MSSPLCWAIAAVVYVAGIAFEAGRRDGIRDGAEGIADEFCIFGWPIVLTWTVLSFPFRIAYCIGRRSSS